MKGLLVAACLLTACGGDERWAPPRAKAGDAAPPTAAAAMPDAAAAAIPDAATSTLPVVPAAIAGPRDALLGQIPHDTPFVLLQRGAATFGSTPTDALLQLRGMAKPFLGWFLSDQAVAQMTPEERRSAAIVRFFTDTDEATLRRIGFGDPARRMALYGLGLVPVVRVELDGALLRERLAAEFARAGATAPATGVSGHASAVAGFSDWHGHAYLEWPLADGAAAFVVMLRDDQLAIAIARRAADVLPHLAGEAPPPRALDEDAVVRAGGVSGQLSMWIDPPHAAALLAGSGAGALPALADAPAGCGAALATVIGGLPPLVTATTTTPDRVAATMRIGPVPDFAATLRPLAHPIAHWPADPPGPGKAQYGLGVGVMPFLQTLVGFVDAMAAAGPACGGEPAGPPKMLLLALFGGPLNALHGFTVVQDLRDKRTNAPPRLVLLVETDDAARLYRAVADKLRLPALPPPFDRLRGFNADGMRGALTLHRDSISGWIGRADAVTLRTLRAAPPGDAALFRFAAGPDAFSRGGHPLDGRVTLDGDYLLVEYGTTLR